MRQGGSLDVGGPAVQQLGSSAPVTLGQGHVPGHGVRPADVVAPLGNRLDQALLDQHAAGAAHGQVRDAPACHDVQRARQPVPWLVTTRQDRGPQLVREPLVYVPALRDLAREVGT